MLAALDLAGPHRSRVARRVDRKALVVYALVTIPCLFLGLREGLLSLTLVAMVVYAAAASMVVIEDLRALRAPNRVVYPALLVVLGLASWTGWDGLVTALLGAVTAFSLLLLSVVVSRGAMGMGDAKFGALGGLVVGVGAVPMMLASAFVVGGLLALVALATHARGRSDAVAFTPFLVLGTLLSVLVGSSTLGT